ncbi:MAG TPA: VOC family protein [Thermoanaerobaculia bacterium]|jgi:catechol 2,3-dioxygenase-like lactoylglutathione lyase family enzyme
MEAVMLLKRLVPMAEVQSVARSIEFYARLGFEVGNTFTPDDATSPTWAWLRHGDVDLMIAAAEQARGAEHSVLFYLYCEDVAEAKRALEASGVSCGPVNYPFYAPKGELEVKDPDGYTLMVTHT